MLIGMTRARIIVNPNAGQKAGVRTNSISVATLQAAVRAHHLPYAIVDIVPTARPGHATRLARQAVQDGCELVVAAGGDGTIREVLPALIGTPVRLGILPLGSAMNTARALGIPRDLDQALDILKHAQRVAAIDIGTVNDAHFVEAAGVGMTAGLFRLLAQLDAGRWDRWRMLIRCLRLARARTLTVEWDGQRGRYRSLSLIVANAPFFGAAIPVAPQAAMDDGRLDLTIFQGETKSALAANWLRLLVGRPLHERPEVLVAQAQHVTVTTRRPALVHADDALAGRTPATFALLKRAVEVVVGPVAPGLAVDRDEQSIAMGGATNHADPVDGGDTSHA
jgi:YegS/Rv2252/BmrU family lipid kinase